jgi:hypothetical protein
MPFASILTLRNNAKLQYQDFFKDQGLVGEKLIVVLLKL